MKYTYHVNLDERGSCFADVRDASGETIYEVRAGNELAEDEMSLVDMGYMRHLSDMAGLTDYLRDIGVIAIADTIVEQ